MIGEGKMPRILAVAAMRRVTRLEIARGDVKPFSQMCQ
jgi:hypothetical protein